MAWFRRITCRVNTYNTYCVVPIDGLPEFQSAEEWCMNYYNSNQCQAIQAIAQSKMSTYSKTYYNVNGAFALITVLMARCACSWCLSRKCRRRHFARQQAAQ